MALFPSLLGAMNATLASTLPAVAVTPVGAPGAVEHSSDPDVSPGVLVIAYENVPFIPAWFKTAAREMNG